MTEQKDKEVELKSCPFCGGHKVGVNRAKKQHCQLHGEPSQAIIINCYNRDCAVKPSLTHGDIYCSSYKEVLAEAAEAWNTRSATDIDVATKLQAQVDMLVESLEAIVKHQSIVCGGELAEISTTKRIAEQALERVKEKGGD